LILVVAAAGLLTALGPTCRATRHPRALAASSLATPVAIVVAGGFAEGRLRWIVPPRGNG